MKIAEFANSIDLMRWLIMSHLIWIYAVFPLVFEFSIQYSLDFIFFGKFIDESFVIRFLVGKKLSLFLNMSAFINHIMKTSQEAFGNL